MRPLRGTGYLTAIIILASASAGATADGLADSWCEWNTTPVPFATAWQVDDGFDDWMRTSSQVPSSFTHQDARGLAEIAIENLARHGRPGVQPRILTGSANCNPLSEPRCIAALTDVEDPWGCGLFTPKAAYTHWSTKSVVFCVDHAAPMFRVPTILEHELGHAHGLNHVEAEPNCSSAPATDCLVAGTADGCEGEKMCRSTGCNGGGPGFAPGDAFGLRTVYFGTAAPVDRWLTTGSAYLPGISGFHFMSPAPGYLSMYAPRIDCARSTSPSIQCAVAHAYFGSSVNFRVVKLSGWNSSGWSNLNYTQTWNIDIQSPPDIALSDDGTVAWATRTTSSASNNVQVRHINLATGSTTAVSLGYHSILSPRIAFYGTNSDPLSQEHALVVGVEGRTGSLSIGRWRLHHVTYFSNSGGLIASAVDFDELDERDDTLGNDDVDVNMIATDFDFDCESEFDGLCVLAAVFWDRENHDPYVMNAVQRRRFRLPFGAGAVTMLDADWARDVTYRAQSVIGVSYANPRLYISSGNFALGSSGVNNTRVVQYRASSATSPESTLLHRGDFDTCMAFVTVDGDPITGATQHGGTSIAYCPSCGYGTLESVHLGHREAPPYDYCF
ncbi:MAG: hypothetical protein IT382_01585 [Deltaproteobacteria bacterium]|nr:hypothetical protein [Deltaproteobacteria bacterium]